MTSLRPPTSDELDRIALKAFEIADRIPDNQINNYGEVVVPGVYDLARQELLDFIIQTVSIEPLPPGTQLEK